VAFVQQANGEAAERDDHERVGVRYSEQIAHSLRRHTIRARWRSYGVISSTDDDMNMVLTHTGDAGNDSVAVVEPSPEIPGRERCDDDTFSLDEAQPERRPE
jgi:hypothetical protein